MLGLLPAVFVLAFILFRPQVAHAATYTAAWINRSTIMVTSSDGESVVLIDSNWDLNWDYRGTIDGSCDITINGFDSDTIVGFSGTNGTTGSGAWTAAASTVNLSVERRATTSCNPDPDWANPTQITISAFQNAQKTFNLDSDNTISRVDSPSDWTFTLGTNPTGNSDFWYYRNSEDGDECQDVIVTNASRTTMTLYEQDTNGNGVGVDSPIDPVGCDLESTIDDMDRGFGNGSNQINDTVPSNFPMALGRPADVPGGVPGGGGGGPAPEEPSCSNAPDTGGISLRWIVCPIMEFLDSGVNFLDTELQKLLLVDDPTDETYAANAALHDSWGRMRNIALIILIPIMLVMVIGTAVGVNWLDAYTVRRAMPRFLIAIIFISISWYITGFLINLTNIVGTGILGLMTRSFGGPSSHLSDYISMQAGITTTLGSLAIFGGLIATGSVTFMIILSYAFVALMILLIGFVLLTIRQLLILALVLFAPLAILSWIFPGNDKLWKLWWGTFSKLLLMFPLIMILVGAGKIFAYVIANTL